MPDPIAAVYARFLLLAERPLVVIDVDDGEEDGLVGAAEQHGMVRLPRFFDVDLPRGVRVGFTLTDDELLLEDERSDPLLRVRRAALDRAWLQAALRLRGTMGLIGRAIGLDPDDTPRRACERVDEAAREGRVVGAIVGVAERRTGLPLFG